MNIDEQNERGRLVAFPQVLILLGLYLFGGGGGEEARSLSEIVASSVTDEARSVRAQDVARRIEARAQDGEQLVVSSLLTLLEAVKDYETKAEQIEALYELQDLDWDQLQGSMVDLRFELKKHLTREEWAAVIGEHTGL